MYTEPFTGVIHGIMLEKHGRKIGIHIVVIFHQMKYFIIVLYRPYLVAALLARRVLGLVSEAS